jgi:UDP-N-acetyl-2-amino-2-deoxyglucuronate dehydrogenase
MGMRAGANVLCEKPLTLSPWNLDVLEKEEIRTGRRVYTVLQLRLMPRLIALRDRVREGRDGQYTVTVNYTTPRGPWYQRSWKGDTDRSGGIITNIGIHLLDMLLWVFGPMTSASVDTRISTAATGRLEFENAYVHWNLSTDGNAKREMVISSPHVHNSVITFDDGFTALHTGVYVQTLAGRGFTIADARPAVELAHMLRTLELHR